MILQINVFLYIYIIIILKVHITSNKIIMNLVLDLNYKNLVACKNMSKGTSDELFQNANRIGIKTKLKKYYENITISSDFDGLDDPLDLFASPRMYPIMALYLANRLKWDLYRRYYGKDPNGPNGLIEGNTDIGPERGQTLNVDDGVYIDPVTNAKGLNAFQIMDETELNITLNDIVKEIMKQILDTNFINLVANAKGWN
jgi:hypothetical protein